MQMPFKYAKQIQITLTEVIESHVPLREGHLLENKFSPQYETIFLCLTITIGKASYKYPFATLHLPNLLHVG